MPERGNEKDSSRKHDASWAFAETVDPALAGPAIPLEHALRALATMVHAAATGDADLSTQATHLQFSDYTYDLIFTVTWKQGQIYPPEVADVD